LRVEASRQSAESGQKVCLMLALLQIVKAIEKYLCVDEKKRAG
jgi:hypothetical protein